MAINRTSPKKGKVVDIPANAPTIGTPTAGAASVSVAFTAPSTTTGGPIYTYQAISNPGSITATASNSPINVTGLTNGTAYTFTVAAGNATGYGPYSSASASATPVDPASFVSIATQTVGAGGASSVTFSGIAQVYKHLEIRIVGPSSANANTVSFQFNGDTSTNYSNHQIYGDGTSAAASASAGDINMGVGMIGSSTAPGASIVYVSDYTNTNKYKTVRGLAGSDNNGSTGYIVLRSGLWRSTSAVTSITIYPSSGTFSQYSSFALYGIQG